MLFLWKKNLEKIVEWRQYFIIFYSKRLSWGLLKINPHMNPIGWGIKDECISNSIRLKFYFNARKGSREIDQGTFGQRQEAQSRDQVHWKSQEWLLQNPSPKRSPLERIRRVPIFSIFFIQTHYHSYIEADEGEDLLRLRQKDLLPLVPIQNVNRVVFWSQEV